MADGKKKSPSPRPWYRKRALRIAAAVLVAAGVLAVVLVFAPTYAARWYAAQLLEDAGVSAEGLDTLDVDIFQRQASIGPFRFRSGEAPHGKVERASFELSYTALLYGRLLFRSMSVGGLDIRISPAPEGSVLVNGVDIDRLAASEEAPEEKTAEPWEIGFDTFRLRDAEITMTRPAGEPVSIAIDRADIDDLRTWAPNQPGTISMAANAGGIPLDASGTIHLLDSVFAADLRHTIGPAGIDRLVDLLQVQGLAQAKGRMAMNLEQDLAVAADGSVRTALSGTARLSDASLSDAAGAAVRVQSAELALSDLQLTVDPGGAIRGTAQAKGNAEAIALSAAGAGPLDVSAETLAVDLAPVTWDGSRQAASATAEGVVAVTGLAASTENMKLDSDRVRLGVTGLALDIAPDGALALSGKPDLSLAGLVLSGDVQASADTITLDLSSLRADTGGRRTSIDAVGSASVGAADLRLPRAGEEPALSTEFESLEVAFQQFTAEVGGADSPQWQGRLDVQLSGLSGKAGDEGDLARAQIGRLDVEEVEAGEEMDIAAREVAVADANVVVTRRFIQEIQGSGSGEDAAAAPGEDGGEAASLEVGRFHTVGDAEIRFRDRMIDPTVQSRLNIDQLQVENLDTARPDQQAQVRLIAVLNEFTDVRVSGQVSPFADQPQFDLDATVEGFDLPEASPYAREYAGVQVQSGQLTAEADAAADEGELDATVDLTVSRLGVEKVADGPLSGIPVKTGLALLEGPDGKIALTLPISGSLDDLEFDFSQAINQAIGGAVRSAIGTSFKILFPPAGIVSVLSGDKGAEVEDVPFEPGSAELTQQARTIVESYAELLARRPRLTLEVCGRATAADLGAHRGEPAEGEPAGRAAGSAGQEAPQLDAGAAMAPLRELALERTRAVRRYLISQAGLPSDRVTSCRPQVNPESSGAPRAEVSL